MTILKLGEMVSGNLLDIDGTQYQVVGLSQTAGSQIKLRNVANRKAAAVYMDADIAVISEGDTVQLYKGESVDEHADH